MSKNVSIHRLARVASFVTILGIMVFSASCSDSNSDSTPAPRVKLASSTSLGSYLSDSEGNALYFFSNDVAGANTCTGGCATAWPLFFEASLTADVLGEGLSMDDFGTITSAAGQQTTYKGWPLYYYAPGGVRETANQTTGEAVGGVWFVAKTDYTIMLAHAQLKGLDGKNYKGDYTEGDGSTVYFSDAKGRSVYSFHVDKKNKNNFSNGDGAHDATWPVYGDALVSVPSALDKTLFGSITVNGSAQLTYKGWPLYYFNKDAVRGDNKGVSVPTPGVWPVVTKDAPEAPAE
ncbi:MAG: hypothetical protein ABI477_21695 [Chryseolinea sp.]